MRLDSNVVNRIKEVQSFPSMLKFLRDDLDWPITSDDVEDLTFDYSPDELGFDKKMAVKVRSIKQLRPLVKDQPWGIFYIDFEPKRLPVGALRRLLRSLVVKKRGGGDGSQATWNLDDLLFISFHGEESRRTVAFAHFHEREQKQPQLRTFYWDQGETEFASVLESLGKLNWPKYAGSAEMAHVWRQYWGAAFRVGHGEVISDSKALSKKLAQVALKIRQHVFDLLDAEDANKGPLHRLFASFKKALLHDLDEQRFADVLAQTFTYGLLAAKAEIGTKTPLEPGHLAEQIPATNPLLRELFEEFQHLTGVGLDKLDEDLGDLGVDELVDLLNTVDVDEALKNFGRTTMSGQEDPVVHFYEAFLRDYDKQQTVERGVFYTPKPVVSFIVRSVHEILQKEFSLEDGLASIATWDDMVAKHDGLAKPEGIRGDEPFVQILDPSVGTGTFLEACIQLIYDTMAAKWNRTGKDVRAEWNLYVPEHLLPRLHGFELMMAPYVVCHMKLGLRLKELGYDFQSGERLRVYLTNTLEPPVQKQEALIGLMDAVAHEAHQANAVKKEVPFSVILGNPPYSNASSNLSEHARALVERYKFVDGVRIRERNALQFERNLNDDYVKFFAWSEAHILKLGFGVLGLISNSVYTWSTSLRGLRSSLRHSFARCTLLNLHGASQRGLRAAADLGDQNVFDIEQPVAIFLGTREPHISGICEYAELIAPSADKYVFLSGHTLATCSFVNLPTTNSEAEFIPSSDDGVSREYDSFLAMDELFDIFGEGIKTGRDSLVVDFELEPIVRRMTDILQSRESDRDLCRRMSINVKKAWNFAQARASLPEDGLPQLVKRYLYRPFDERFLFYHPKWIASASRPTMRHLQREPEASGTASCIAILVGRTSRNGESILVWCTDSLVDKSVASSLDNVSVFPSTRLVDEGTLLGDAQRVANWSSTGGRLLKAVFDALGFSIETEVNKANLFQYYAYAVLWSPTYRSRYRERLVKAFPRIPIPYQAKTLTLLAEAGTRLAALHLLYKDHVAVAPSRYVGVQSPVVTDVSWRDGEIALGKSRDASFRASEVLFQFRVGGYQPAQKWLKDRKGLILSEVDIRHYEQILYAIEGTIRIMGEIDEVIESHGGWPGAFQGSSNG